jgi:hypothetical protein
MFNVCANAVMREWLWGTIDKEATHRRFAGASREIVAFFVDDGLVGLRDPVWLQSTLNVLVTLFESIGLRTNPDKTKVMMCIPGNTGSPHRNGVPHATVLTSQPHRKVSLGGVQHLWHEPSSGILPQPSGDKA